MSVHITEWPIPKVCDCHPPKSERTVFYEIILSSEYETVRMAIFMMKNQALREFNQMAETTMDIDLVEVAVKDDGSFETLVVLTNKN